MKMGIFWEGYAREDLYTLCRKRGGGGGGDGRGLKFCWRSFCGFLLCWNLFSGVWRFRRADYGHLFVLTWVRFNKYRKLCFDIIVSFFFFSIIINFRSRRFQKWAGPVIQEIYPFLFPFILYGLFKNNL